MSFDGALKLVSPPDAAPGLSLSKSGLTWISLETASARAGLDIGSTRRLCYGWVTTGKARKTVNPATGREAWEVHESADTRLVPVKFASQLAAEFNPSKLTARQRAVYDFRTGILNRWTDVWAGAKDLGLTRRAAMERFCERLKLEDIKVSVATLYGWEGLAKKGPDYLLDGRSDVTTAITSARESDPFLKEVARLWLRQGGPKIKTCYDHVANFIAPDHGWIIPSLKTAERFLKSLPQQLVIKMRDGETAFTNKVLPHVTRDYSSLRSNDWWCSDHHQFDVVVEIGRDKDNCPIFDRPWITVWQDLRSRKIVGWMIFAHAPNQTTILYTFRSAALAVGLPHHILIDNGKDYDSYTLQGLTKKQRSKQRKFKLEIDTPARGVMGNLKVQVHHALPYKARSKPVERFFGTACTRFSKFIPCYCGRNPQERPEDHLAQLKGGNALTLNAFIDRFGVWLENDYHANKHSGDGLDGELSPNEAFDQCLESKRAISREALELLIQRTSQPLNATANGVNFDGLTYGMGQTDLLYPFFGRGKQVYLRIDPDDVTRATAWTLDDKLIGILTANGSGAFGPIGDAELRRAKAASKRVAKVTKEFYALGYERVADTLDIVGMQRRADAQTARTAAQLPPPSLQLVQNPMEQQARQLESLKARQQLRIAGGNEPASDDTIDLLAASEQMEIDNHRDQKDEPDFDLMRIFSDDNDGGST